MDIQCLREHNGESTLLWLPDFPGAFTRGPNLELALAKVEHELISYLRWAVLPRPNEAIKPILSGSYESQVEIAAADTDIFFDNENECLNEDDYLWLKGMVLKSAVDLQALYELIPDTQKSLREESPCFHGICPATAEAMYTHCLKVNSHYWAQLGLTADCEGTVIECRKRGFNALEAQAGFLQNKVFQNTDEVWTLRKVLRRFIWHDRIHGKALYRRATDTFNGLKLPNVFGA